MIRVFFCSVRITLRFSRAASRSHRAASAASACWAVRSNVFFVNDIARECDYVEVTRRAALVTPTVMKPKP